MPHGISMRAQEGQRRSSPPAHGQLGTSTFLRASEDASVVLFRTSNRLVPAHTSTSQTGYYRRAGSQTDLIVTYPASNLTDAPFVLSGDGSHVFYTTKSPHVPGDVDGNDDVYGWHDGVTELISTGPGDTHTTSAEGALSSFDGERVFFGSGEPLVPGDADGLSQDIFERSGGTTFQITPGPSDNIAALSRDGARLLLSSSRPLVAADTDAARRDVYLFTSAAALAFGPALSATAPAPSPTPPAESRTGEHRHRIAQHRERQARDGDPGPAGRIPPRNRQPGRNRIRVRHRRGGVPGQGACMVA